mmetsp:Transcript_482/g.647  ORF Transcript_482/g.647 Transcript_482/m.647 type:complete len:326 (-) Transcript_482:199-1176(-)
MHRCELGRIGICNVYIHALTLINKGSAIGSHIQDHPLRNLPNCFVYFTNMLGDFRYVLHRSTISNDSITNGGDPQSARGKLTQKMFVHNSEFSSQHSTVVHIRSIRFGTLVVSKNLRGGSSWHGCDKQRVAHSVLCNILLEPGPVPSIAGRDIPHVILEDTLTSWRTFVCFIRTLLLRRVARGSAGTEIDGLENILIERLRSLGLKWDLQHLEYISKTLDTDSNWAMTHIGSTAFLSWVEIPIDDSVQVSRNNLSDFLQLVEIEASACSTVISCRSGQLGQADTGQVTNSNLIRSSVLHDLRTKVGTTNSPQILLVRLVIAMIFE